VLVSSPWIRSSVAIKERDVSELRFKAKNLGYFNMNDLRWKQRFNNYKKALSQLKYAIELKRQRALSDLENQGLIQSFEFTYELGWNTLKDYLVWQGIEGIVGSRDTIREAFSRCLIADGDIWMKMLVDKNGTSHTYNEKTANEILQNNDQMYVAELMELEDKLHQLATRDQ
jgi:nucleotidyltransferase substrate binding protein (TIGR01987 family)